MDNIYKHILNFGKFHGIISDEEKFYHLPDKRISDRLKLAFEQIEIEFFPLNYLFRFCN